MDNELKIFNYEEHEIRTVEREDGVWWVLRDVCNAMRLSNTGDVATRLDPDEVDQTDVVDRRGRKQMQYVVNEAGLYNVILRSDKPEAKKFKRWVTHEVLPSLRGTGSYSIQPQKQMTPAELLAAQANLLVDLERRTSAIEQKVDRALTAMARPEADTWTADMKEAIRAYCEITGLTDAMARGRLYAALDREAKCSTDARLRLLRERKKKVGETRKSYMALTKLDAIAIDGKLRSAFEGIVARETARAAVK